jgi:hypothetical protein
VRLMLGRPAFCDTRIPENLGQEDVRRVIRDNSCVKRRMGAMLRAETPETMSVP